MITTDYEKYVPSCADEPFRLDITSWTVLEESEVDAELDRRAEQAYTIRRIASAVFATHLLVVGAGSVVLDPLAPPVGVFMLGIAVGVAGIVVPNQFFVRLRRRTGIPLPGELRELVEKVAPLMAERLSLYRNLARIEYSGWTAPMKRARSRWIAWRFNRAIRRFGWLMTDRAERAHRAARRGHWGRWHTHVTTMLEGLSHAVREEAPAAEKSRHY